MIQVLLNNNNIIYSSSRGEEAGLIMPNNILKKGLDSVGNYFGDNFVLVLQSSMSLKFLREESIFALRN